jgi:hypothetical protein
MVRMTLAVLVVLWLTSASLWSQIKVGTITDETDPTSKAMMTELRAKLASHPKQFTLVSTEDADIHLIVQADCFPQKQKTDAFACYYTSTYVGIATRTFMGGGIYVAATADDVADNVLVSIAQDILERWGQMNRTNALETLEACLFLTQSSCKVPTALEPELKAQIINLSQYLQRGALKK